MKKIEARDLFDYTGSYSPNISDEEPETDANEQFGRLHQVEMVGLTGKTLLPDGIYLWCEECGELHDAETNFDLHLWKWVPIPMEGGEIKL